MKPDVNTICPTESCFHTFLYFWLPATKNYHPQQIVFLFLALPVMFVAHAGYVLDMFPALPVSFLACFTAGLFTTV